MSIKNKAIQENYRKWLHIQAGLEYSFKNIDNEEKFYTHNEYELLHKAKYSVNRTDDLPIIQMNQGSYFVGSESYFYTDYVDTPELHALNNALKNIYKGTI